MNFEFLTGVLIKYHVLFYYLALGLNIFFIRGGVSAAFTVFVGFFWVFCLDLALVVLLEKLP